jgi:hypothetical protein
MNPKFDKKYKILTIYLEYNDMGKKPTHATVPLSPDRAAPASAAMLAREVPSRLGISFGDKINRHWWRSV